MYFNCLYFLKVQVNTVLMGTLLDPSHLPFWIFSCPLLSPATTAATSPTPLEGLHSGTIHLNLTWTCEFISLEPAQVPLTPVPGILWCYSMEHPWKSTWCPCTCNLELQGNYPWGYPWLTRHQNQSINAFFFRPLSGWLWCSFHEAHQKICRIKQQSPTVRPVQEYSHVLAVSNSLINFSHSSPQYPEITFQINFFHTRLSLRLCFERNPS